MTNGCKSLSENELTLLLSYVKNIRNRTLIILGIKSGFRISELLSLKVSNVCQYGRVTGRVKVSKKNMKGKISSRSVPLHNDAIIMLQKLISDSNLTDDDYIFQSREGVNKPITACQAWRIITNASQAAKIDGKVATHSLRKSFAQKIYIMTGKDLVATQKALGHNNIDSTSKYIAVNQDEIDNIIRST